MSSEQKFYVNEDGTSIGSYDGDGPGYGIAVPIFPTDGRMRWDFEKEQWYWRREDALPTAKANLNEEFTMAMQRLQAPWPLHEVLTWDRQSYEAARWEAAPADAKPETPFLTSLFEKCAALGAEDTFEALVSRVRANDRMYTEAVTSIMAIRHVAESQIEASEEPMSVTWHFPRNIAE